jgi:asparagine synthase (glutamine-hydrolysing)
MCGIFLCLLPGCYEKNEELANRCKKRGPDNTKFLVTNDFYMCFHRLAINDLSDDGNQPFYQNNIYMMCNGEIYNSEELKNKYKIVTKSKSDCEVILHLYEKIGFDLMIKSLSGYFALVLIDMNIKKCFVARDRIGVRSLYMSHDNNYFASEIKCIPGKSKHFPPGKYLKIDLTTHNSEEITFFDYNFKLHCDPENICISNIRRLMLNACKKRIPDVPFVCLLSGGLDSTIVAACLNKYCHKLITCSIGFKDSEDLKYARIAATYLNSEHYEFIVTEEEQLSEIESTIYDNEIIDTTTIRASTPMRLLCKKLKLVLPEIRRVFSGELSDEMSGSYLYFYFSPSLQAFRNERLRLMKEVHVFDCCRADKSIASQGMEGSFPFDDDEFVDYYMGIEDSLLFPDKSRIEKYLLREAFKDMIPQEVYNRRKEAFSDGVSSKTRSWFDIIKEYTDKKMEGVNLGKETSENKYYETIFIKYFGEENIEGVLPYGFWLPRWTNQNDPSARKLSLYF